MLNEPSICDDPCYGWRRHLEAKRDTPRINGSSGAFVAVVLCLVFIIVVACSAILFLLRDQRAFDAEQAHHPKRNHPSTDSTHPVARLRWASRLRAFFDRPKNVGANGAKINTQVQTRGGGEHGWIQAGSTEDWESYPGVRITRPSAVWEASSVSPPPLQDTPFAKPPSPISRNTSDSDSSIHFDNHGIRGLSHAEMRSPHSPLPNIHSQLSSPSTSPKSSHIHLHNVYPETSPDFLQHHNDSREYVGSSGVVMRTLPGGTKFVEGL